MNVLTAPIFGPKHLLGLLFVLLLNVLLYVVFRKHVTTEKRFVRVVLVAFYLMEFLKLGYMTIRDGSFPMNHIPLHLCSIPLYAYLVWFLAKDGLVQRAAKSTAYGVVLIAGITALVIPVNIIGNESSWALVEPNFLPYLSFVFHGLMIFSSWYMIQAGFLLLRQRNILEAIAFTSVLMVIALVVNAITGSDFMLLNEGKGSPLVFLRDTSQLLYSLTMILLGYLMVGLTFLVGLLLTKGRTSHD